MRKSGNDQQIMAIEKEEREKEKIFLKYIFGNKNGKQIFKIQ